MIRLRLKAGRQKSVLRRHPWVFASALDEIEGEPQDGETVCLTSSGGEFLAWGAISLASQIRLRLWSWDPEAEIGEAFFRERIMRALDMRRTIGVPSASNACRLVYAESDGLPGLVVDRYADFLVVQLLSSGAEHWKDLLVDLLADITGVTNLYERSDVDVRRLEGLPMRSGVLRGAAPPERVEIFENGLRLWVDLKLGHKTGFYLDQRNNRQRLASLAPGKDVLDCFCYSGGFTIAGLQGGAKSVTAVDSSSTALALAGKNLELNGLASSDCRTIEGDVFQVLRTLRDRGEQFDLLVLDPPKFAPTVSQVQRAARGYKDINMLAFKLLRPGGLLVTFSCSGGVDLALFQSIVAGAALDAGVQASLIEVLTQAPDHPVALNFPESAYLKGLIVKVEMSGIEPESERFVPRISTSVAG